LAGWRIIDFVYLFTLVLLLFYSQLSFFSFPPIACGSAATASTSFPSRLLCVSPLIGCCFYTLHASQCLYIPEKEEEEEEEGAIVAMQTDV
jgi:hypothetical protein